MTAPVFALTHLDSSYRPDRIGMCFWLTQDVEVNFVLLRLLGALTHYINFSTNRALFLSHWPPPQFSSGGWNQPSEPLKPQVSNLQLPRFLVRRFSGPGGEDQREVWSKEAERLAEVDITLISPQKRLNSCASRVWGHWGFWIKRTAGY